MAELALISPLIYQGGQKAMCDNDCGSTNTTRTYTKLIHIHSFSHPHTQGTNTSMGKHVHMLPLKCAQRLVTKYKH